MLRTPSPSYEQDNTGAVTAAHTYSYGTAGAQPHTLTKTVTTGSGAGTDNYTYDPAGNTKTRALNGKPTQNLSFDAEGRLTSDSDGAAASAAYVYDADGTQLIRRDATTTTLYLGTTELHLNNTTGTVAGDRYFSYSGGPTIVESGGSTPAISYEAGNPQNTASTTIAASPTTADKAVTARRATTPFNTPRGTGNTTSPWNAAFPDDHTFLGMTTDTTTALVDVGARKYDPTLGRFLSIDPVFQPDSPQDLGGYAYAADDPINHADPSGQCWVCLSSIVKVVNVVAQAAPVLNVIAEATAAVPGLNVVTAGMAAVGDVAMVASNVIGVVQGADAVYHDIKDGKSLLDTGMDVFDTVSSARGLKGAGSELRGAKDRVSRAARGDADAAAEGTAAGVDAVDDTPATDHGSSQGSDSDNCATRAHSFKGDTPVLMADGTRKLISQVRVGDEIADAVPDGRDEKHRVDAVHVTLTDTDFTDLTVNTPDGAKPITTTQNHPFFDVTQDKFVPAGELKPGDQLQTTGGGRLTVLAVRNYVSTMVTFDLTIDGLHTYYVEAGATPVLVHNCDLHDMARAESAKSESNNTAAAMARDRYTGVTEYGESGMTPKEVHPALKDRLDDLVKEHGSLEEWPAGECAEFNACNNLLLKHGSVNPDEVEYATIVRKTGEIYPSCENCRTILHGAGMHERAF